MECKLVEIRDHATFIPALAIRLTSEEEVERYLLARAGYGTNRIQQANYIILTNLAGGVGKATCDPHDWSNRTMQNAHRWLELRENWETHESGDVLDVEYILEEVSVPKISERFEEPRL